MGLSRHRLNLTIRGNVTVKRILFDTSGARPSATGVEAVSGEEAFTAEGSPVENDMIVYLLSAMGMRRNMGGRHEDVVGMGANLGLNLAFAKGEVRLSSGDYRDQPYLDYNLLAHEEDLRRFRDGVRLVVSLEDHPAMAALIERRVYPEDSDLKSD